VASSLYYLHLNTEEDAQLLADNQGAIAEETEPDEGSQKPVQRKPLPETARVSLDINRQGQTGSGNNSFAPVQAPPRPQGNVQQRLMGPRPLLSDSNSRGPLPGSLSSRPPESAVSTISVGSPKHSVSKRDNIETTKRSTKAFLITIIRRDPSSGAQWNVGTVEGEPQNPEPGPSHSKKPAFDMLVRITTPGYGQFKNFQYNTRSERSNSGAGIASVSNPLPVVNNNAEQSNFPSVSTLGFERDLRMEGLSFWDRTKHKRALSDLPGTRRTYGSGHHDFDSQRNLPSVQSSEGPSDSGVKGYVFTSPWGGRCKFSTGTTGRSLHLQHTLPGPISASSTSEFAQPPVPVSELRFNLPFSNPVKSRTNESGHFSIPRFGHIRNKLSPDKITRPPPPLPPRPRPTSYAARSSSEEDDPPPLPPRPDRYIYTTEPTSERGVLPNSGRRYSSPWAPSEEEARLDLSIGQERAGGGHRGKRAKLGKLIIYDEGFKMLDLVIAANIGVWWSVWETD